MIKIFEYPVSKIKENPNNPRFIRDKKFDELVQSMEEFPKMLKLSPIVIDENDTALGGNMRLRGYRHLGIKKAWVVRADDLDEDEKREFIIKHNLPYGEWAWDSIRSEWDVPVLEAWGLVVPSGETKTVSFEASTTFNLKVRCKTEDAKQALAARLIDEGYDVQMPK